MFETSFTELNRHFANVRQTLMKLMMCWFAEKSSTVDVGENCHLLDLSLVGFTVVYRGPNTLVI